MRCLDKDLMNDFFHDSENNFVPSEFHYAVDPIIDRMIGESYSPDNLPQICFKVACDIAKKRKRYLTGRACKKPVSKPRAKQGTTVDLSKDDHEDSNEDDHDGADDEDDHDHDGADEDDHDHDGADEDDHDHA